jgi:hypothetical protein
VKQLNLFEDERDRSLSPRPEKLVMNKDALIRWKQRIFEDRNSVRQQEPPQQQTLFELPKTT